MENNLTPKRKLYVKAALVVIAATVMVIGITRITSYQKEVPLPASVNSVSNSAQVTVDADGFSPATTTIKKGTMVTWQNTDSDTYSQIMSNASPSDPSATQLSTLSSPRMNVDGTYSYTFSQPGTYSYHDTFNEQSNGTVIVTQ